MRLTAAHIESYGHFDSKSVDFQVDRVVVVYGPNEAGKTTFASFLTSMLFGFAPAKLDQHPYTPAGDGSILEGSVDFISADRRRCSIRRELKSTPRSKYVSGEGLFGDEEDLRNRSLPAVDHISRRVFESVYSVGLADMERIEARTWDFIQDRLLGGLNMDFLKPSRIVIESLEQEAKSFWRPDRRGKPIASGLEDDLKDLQRRLRNARDDDRKVRALASGILEMNEKHAALKKERIELKHTQLVFTKLQPIQNIRTRISELQLAAGDITIFANAPDDPIAHLRDIRSRRKAMEGRLLSLTEDIRDGAKTISDYGPEQSRLRQEEDEVRSWATRVGRHESAVADLEEAERQLLDLKQRAIPLIRSTISSANDDAVLTRLSGIDVAALSSEFDQLESIDRSQNQRQLTGRLLKHTQQACVVGGVIGLTFLIIGLLGNISVVTTIGVVFLVTSLTAIISSAVYGRRYFNGNTDKRGSIQSGIAARLSPISILDSRWSSGSRDLYFDLHRLVDLSQEYKRISERLKRLRDTVEDDNVRLRGLALGLGTDNHAPPTVLIARMMRDLESANYKYRAAENARQRQQPLMREKKSVDDSVRRLLAEEDSITQLLDDLGHGDLQQGAQVIVERRRANLYAEELATTLEKDYPDWRNIVVEKPSEGSNRIDVSGTQPAVESSLVDHMGVALRLDEVEDELQRLASRIAAAKEQARALVDGVPVSDLESRIQSVKNDLRSAKIQRDRRLLMAEVLRRSEHQFREENQPDVVRKANEYLKIISGGRYNSLVVDDVTGELKLWSEDTGGLHEVAAPLSRGTIDQIYLALRVAIIDHLDRNHERVPVFLDEVLVNWDVKRRAKAYAILKNVAADRQVFLFTCHQWLVDEAKDLLDAQVVQL